eukprot:2309250-Amphidinium_carterae.1
MSMPFSLGHQYFKKLDPQVPSWRGSGPPQAECFRHCKSNGLGQVQVSAPWSGHFSHDVQTAYHTAHLERQTKISSKTTTRLAVLTAKRKAMVKAREEAFRATTWDHLFPRRPHL